MFVDHSRSLSERLLDITTFVELTPTYAPEGEARQSGMDDPIVRTESSAARFLHHHVHNLQKVKVGVQH